MDTQKDPRIITPMPQTLVERIKDYQFANRMETRAEAIRQLIELGLEAAQQRQKEVAK